MNHHLLLVSLTGNQEILPWQNNLMDQKRVDEVRENAKRRMANTPYRDQFG